MDDFRKENYKIFDLFKNQWALVTAGTIDKYNTCTVAWGSFGTLWARPDKTDGSIITVYIHPARYTLEFMKENDIFTVSFFSKEHQKALAYLGTHSGRDEDKVKLSGLTPISIGNSVTYKEASTTFVCKKIYHQQFIKDNIASEIKNYYINNPKSFPLNSKGEWEAHWMFIGDVIDVK